MTTDRTRSNGIDLLRGIAVSMVLLVHLPFSYRGLDDAAASTGIFPPKEITDRLAFGTYGVQLFLVISGYCIHARWARKADLSVKVAFLPFWKRRLTRLYPPFLFTLIVCLALVVAAHQVGPGTAISWTQLGADLVVLLLLLQYMTDASAHMANGPFWSLALEEHLYLLYFPLLYVRRRFGWAAGLLLPLVVLIVWLGLGSLFHLDEVWPHWRRSPMFYWFCWALGALAAESHFKHVQLPKFLASPWLFAGGILAATQVGSIAQDLVVTSSFFVLVLWVVRLEDAGMLSKIPGTGPLVGLGKISYGVYLVHYPTFVIVKRILVTFHVPSPLILLIRLASGIVVGYIMYRLVEKPFLLRSQQIVVPLIPDRALAAAVASE